MTGPQVLTIIGMFVEMIGFSIVGRYLFKQWKRTAFDDQTFFPARLLKLICWLFRRTPEAVATRAAGDGAGASEAGSVEARFVFDETGSVEDRLRGLESALNSVYQSQLTATSSMSLRVDAVESSLSQADRALMARINESETERTRESANELRNAGWGLIFAVIGLAIQLIASMV